MKEERPSCVLTDFGRAPPPLDQDAGIPVTFQDSAGPQVKDQVPDSEPFSSFPGVRSCAFVHWLHSHNLYTVDLESLEASGPRIEATILEPAGYQVVAASMSQWLARQVTPKTPWPSQQPSEPWASLRSQRVRVGFRALKILLSKDVVARSLCATYCLELAVLETISLSSRLSMVLQLVVPDGLQLFNFFEGLYAALQTVT